MERMVVPVRWKSVNADGELEGYASTFGNVDLGRDVVEKGAFLDTIKDINAVGIPLLADHSATTASVLGTITKAKEDKHGLYVWATFSSAASAQDVRTKAAEGHLGFMSIGYGVIEDALVQRDGKTVRSLRKVKLHEISVVVFPMNTQAAITAAKSAGEKTYMDLRRQLDDTLRETYGDEKTDVWVRDFDDAKVWFEVWEADDSGTYEQAYTNADGQVSLDGDRTRVRAVTTYVPIEDDNKSGDEPTEVKSDPPTDSPRNGDAEARHAKAEAADGAPAGVAPSTWDHWASEAVLAGHNDPAQPVDSPERLACKTQFGFLTAALEQHSDPHLPADSDERLALTASLGTALRYPTTKE